MITHEMLKTAASKSCEMYVDYLLEDYAPENEHIFSALFIKRLHRLRRKADHIFLYHSLRRIAIILLTLLITASTWLATDVSARNAFWGWIKELYGTFFVYRYSDDISPDANFFKYRPMWIPEDYTEIYSGDDGESGQVLYSNSKGQYLQFHYIVRPDESSLFIENTDITITEVNVNHNIAHYLKSNNDEFSNALMWTDEKGHAFYLSAFEDIQTLIRIAQSISTFE